MEKSTNIQRLHNKKQYYFWVGVFVFVLAGIIGGMYYTTQQIDYVWRWYRVPQYFVYHEEVEVRAEIEGEVKSIAPTGDSVTIVLDAGESDVTEVVPAISEIHVSAGDFISPGDPLASYKRWRVGILLQGLWMTLKVSLYAIVFGILIGLIGGISRLSANPAAKWLSMAYVEFIRGSPLLVQIFIWYFVIGTMINSIMTKRGWGQVDPMWYGVAALSFFAGAYITEIVRAGIQSIHRGQFEAARSLGMSAGQAMRYVILPQAMRRILPPLAGEFINLIKDSSLLGIIAVRELTKATREVITASLQPFELYFTCAILYLLLTFTLSMFVQHLERRLAK